MWSQKKRKKKEVKEKKEKMEKRRKGWRTLRKKRIRDLDETVEKEEVVSVLCLALGRPAFEGSCRLFIRFGGVKTAVIRLAEADAARLLQQGKLRIGWVA